MNLINKKKKNLKENSNMISWSIKLGWQLTKKIDKKDDQIRYHSIRGNISAS